MIHIAAIQLATLPMNESKLDYYARICDKKNIRLVVLGEYVLNNFFHELKQMPKNIIKAQSTHKIAMLKSLSEKYNITFIAPIIHIANGKITKSILKASPKSMRYYQQNFFINFDHWNEAAYFHDKSDKFLLASFSHEGLKCAAIFGYEIHFDYVWEMIDKEKIDLVLMPSVCTFESTKRWNEILKMRAFTHNVYILRVNRIGSSKFNDEEWRFYGHSLLTNPYGEIEECLSDEEAMLITQIDKNQVKEAKKLFNWRKTLAKKGL